jgi:hypothetical protein
MKIESEYTKIVRLKADKLVLGAVGLRALLGRAATVLARWEELGG